MVTITYDIPTLEDLPGVAGRIREDFGDHTVFLLYGTLGAGKTTLVQAICRDLDVVDEVVSPTYTIINEYKTMTDTMVYHVDLYRVGSLEEALQTGIEDYIYSGFPIFIEWPQVVEDIIPAKFVKLEFHSPPAGGRTIMAEPHV